MLSTTLGCVAVQRLGQQHQGWPLNPLETVYVNTTISHIERKHTTRIEFPDFIPAFPKRQWWVKFQHPQLDSTRDHRSIVFGQQLFRDWLIRIHTIQGLTKVMNGGKRHIVDPGLPLLCCLKQDRSSIMYGKIKNI